MIILNINSEESPKQSLCAERSPVVVVIIGQWHGMHYPVASTPKSNIGQRFWKLFLSLILTRVGWAVEKKGFLKLKVWTSAFGNSYETFCCCSQSLTLCWGLPWQLCWGAGHLAAGWEGPVRPPLHAPVKQKRIVWTAKGSGGLFNPDSRGFLHTLSKHHDSWAHSCLCKRQHQGDNSVFNPSDPSMKAFIGNRNLRKRKQQSTSKCSWKMQLEVVYSGAKKLLV